ncbi:MAG TPA: anti-phage dCTP deaminase [Stellaceae bacterium]|nr:anti-phage dCTP deaminase [Stellaceae bacterium]
MLTRRKKREAERSERHSIKSAATRADRHHITSSQLLAPISHPELVFGLVAPIGTELRTVAEELEMGLRTVGYHAIHVHVTDTLKEFPGVFKLKERPTEEKYRTYMDAGNRIREKLDRADALALLTVLAIRRQRAEMQGGHRLSPQSRTAWILNQFKRPEEISTLRRIYGRGFVQISTYCSADKRLDDLTNRIAKSYYRQRRIEAYRGKAQDLISRDDEEEEVEFGQRMRETFAMADVVINADSPDKMKESCSRFLRGFFGDNFCTPSRDEHGMFLAKAAALKSSDLSRQVGSAIVAETGEVISLGCNEVPKTGGGAYWEGDEFDFRDFHVGYDSSAKVKREILEDLFRRLKGGKWLSAKRQRLEIEALTEQALADEGIIKEAQIMDSLEFGRIVHAEMSALTEAARHGTSVRGATLYSTTFPCHICARHIVAAGIKRVVYIEPYSKSLAAELYPDSIEVEGRKKRAGPKVQFDPFIGIAPVRYAELFAKGRRKDSDGKPILWNPADAKPILERLVPAYIQIENAVAAAVPELLKNARLSARSSR